MTRNRSSASARVSAARAPAPAKASRARKRALPFKIADRYLFFQVIAATFRIQLIFASILLLVGTSALSRKVGLSGLLPVLHLQLPRIFLFTLPMSLIYGTLQTFGELSGRGEITAMGAGGMSLPRLMRAPFLWGAILAVTAFWVQEVLVPGAETRKSEQVGKQVLAGIGVQKNFSFRDPPRGPLKKIVQAKLFDPKSNSLISPHLLFFRRSDGGLEREVVAKKGTWNEQTGRWKFFSVKITEYRGRADSPFPVIMNTDVAENENIPNPRAMNKATKSRAEHLANGDFEMVSTGDLLDYRSELAAKRASLRSSADIQENRKLSSGATYGIHDKIATPLVCLALILVGCPLGIRPQRSSGGVSFGTSLIVILLYYSVWTWIAFGGKSGTVNPYFAAYLPLGLTTIIGAALLWKKSR